jgi:hypothetical protein
MMETPLPMMQGAAPTLGSAMPMVGNAFAAQSPPVTMMY